MLVKSLQYEKTAFDLWEKHNNSSNDDIYDDGDQNYYIQLSGDGEFSSSLLNEKIMGTNADND